MRHQLKHYLATTTETVKDGKHINIKQTSILAYNIY